jgi:FSR family fosmidomycin resistance protein-like MFS transporter
MTREEIQQETNMTAFRVLIALSAIHCMNDALQSVVSASYPVLKNDMQLSFGHIGLITLTYQMAASIFQPFVGLFFDRKPSVWPLPAGMLFTLGGLLLLAYSTTFYWTLCAVFMVGTGSSTFHPEASRLTSISSGGKRGLAQSIFQVGGNFGSSMGPLLVAAIVAPHARTHIACFSILPVIALMVMAPVCKWYRKRLKLVSVTPKADVVPVEFPYPRAKTVFTIIILLVLIFSKYVYMSSLTSYFTFYLIEKFHVSIQHSQIFLFVFLIATAIGTITGGPLGDRIGRKYVIWLSILGAAPFTLLMPHVSLAWTVILSFFAGLVLSSAFPAILVYAQELLPYKLGLVSGLFYGFSFGIAGTASAFLGRQADIYGIETVYNLCSFMPLMGVAAVLLPDMKRRVSG